MNLMITIGLRVCVNDVVGHRILLTLVGEYLPLELLLVRSHLYLTGFGIGFNGQI